MLIFRRALFRARFALSRRVLAGVGASVGFGFVAWCREAVRRPTTAVSGIALMALLFGVLQIGAYGVTSDEPALFYAGDRTLFYLGHRQLPDALNFNGPEPPGFSSVFDRRQASYNDPIWCPVFPSLVAAATSRVVHDWLGWMNVVDGHHLGLVLIHVLGLLFFGRYACRLLGGGAGVLATVALALFPSALGHSFNNPKDWPCALFYGVGVLAAGVGVVEGRIRHLMAGGLFAGLALSGKANGLFATVTLLVWLPLAYGILYRRDRARWPTIVAAATALPYVAAAMFVLMWPWLWSGNLGDDWKRLSEYVRFVIERGVGPHTHWTAYPFICLFAMTPPIVLTGAAVGLCTGWRADGRRRAAWALVIVWLALPLLRIAAPRSNFYDANRHFLEYVPALCCLAGIGLGRAFAWARRAVRPKLATVVAVALVTAGLVTPVVASHPYETAYFNRLVGGLGGAQRRHLLAPPSPHEAHAVGSEGDYWWSSLRNGLAYIRDHTPARTIGVCGASTLHAQMNWIGPAPMPQIEGSTDGYGIGVREIEQAEYVYVMPREYFCSADRIRSLEAQRPVIHREMRGGGLIFEILGPARGRREVQK